MKIEFNILISVFFGAGGGGLLYLVLKTYLIEKIRRQIQYTYDLDLLKARTEIKSEYEIKFEIARKELEKRATEHKIKYSKLHIDQSEKLKEIYEKLIDTEASLETFTHLGQGPEWFNDSAREVTAEKEHEVLVSLVKRGRIYLPEKLCQDLDSLCSDYKEVITEMSIAKDLARMGNQDHSIDTWRELRDKVKNDFIKTRCLIEVEFRNLLGT
jgi:hypothetical protein